MEREWSLAKKRMAELSRGARQLSAEALRRRLLERVTKFCAGRFEDDVTLLAVAVSEKDDRALTYVTGSGHDVRWLAAIDRRVRKAVRS
jgi:hypothetical protein